MQVTALDEADKKVDWFFIYKVPQLSAGATTDKTTGYEYVYYDCLRGVRKAHEIRSIPRLPGTVGLTS
jgi:deoxyribonuclease-2